eukprot:scpid77764/ scgid8930/ 
MTDLLSALPGNICMMDDALIFGSTLEEEVGNLRPALSHLQSAGVTLNSKKCQFHATSINFLGPSMTVASIQMRTKSTQLGIFLSKHYNIHIFLAVKMSNLPYANKCSCRDHCANQTARWVCVCDLDNSHVSDFTPFSR